MPVRSPPRNNPGRNAADAGSASPATSLAAEDPAFAFVVGFGCGSPGPDGLAAIRALLALLSGRRRVALLALEVGAGQARTVAALTRDAGFRVVRAERDLAGIERVVVGER